MGRMTSLGGLSWFILEDYHVYRLEDHRLESVPIVGEGKKTPRSTGRSNGGFPSMGVALKIAGRFFVRENPNYNWLVVSTYPSEK